MIGAGLPRDRGARGGVTGVKGQTRQTPQLGVPKAPTPLSLHNNLTTQKKARFGRAACTPVRLTAIPLCLPQQPK